MQRLVQTTSVALLAALAITACGASGESSQGTAPKIAPVSAEIPATGCGSAATPQPKDPDGVLASLPQKYKDQYAGYKGTVRRSLWSDFKPDHPPPYKVGLSFAQLTVSSQVGMYESIKKNLESDPGIEFTGVTTGGQLNIPQQLQQFSSLIDQNPDLLIVEPLTDAFGPLVDKAAKRGIPTISVQGTTDSASAVNMQSNDYGAGVQGASAVIRQMGSKGNVLFLHGIASTTVDQDAYSSFRAVLKRCPQVKEIGQIAGAFVPATAKAETLKFLATHPEPIHGVVETGGMAPGVISAFKQAGRPVPVVNDRAGQKASLGYWINNKGSYRGFAQGYPPGRYGESIANLAKRILAGRGLQTSNVVAFYPPIAESNLAEWADKGWNLQTPGTSEGPPGAFMSDAYLSGFFNDPAPAQ